MPRRQGKLEIYRLGEITFVPGTRFPKKELTYVKSAIFFEQDKYENSQGVAKQEVSENRLRVKIRYSNDVYPNDRVLYQGQWYKVWRTWSDSRKYLELYLSAWDYDSNGEMDNIGQN